MAQRIASWSLETAVRDRFSGGEAANFLFYFWGFWRRNNGVSNRRKRFFGEMWGNTVWGRGDEGTCQNPVRLSIYDGAMEAVDYMWVNIWCMLQAKLDCWISSQGCKSTRPRENTFSPFGVSNPGFRGGNWLLYYKFHFLFYPTTTAQGWRWTHCSSQPLHKTFFPVPLHPGIQLNQSTWYQPWGVAHLSLLPGSRLISSAYGLTKRLFPNPVTIWPSPKVAYSFGSSVYPRPDLAHVHTQHPHSLQ